MNSRGRNKIFFFLPVVAFVFLFFCSATPILSQADGTIQGKILDEKNLRPIEGGTVRIAKLNREEISNADGEYILNDIPPGSYKVICSASNYETQVITNIRVKSGQSVSLDFNLKEALPRIREEVTVEAELIPEIQPSSSSSFVFNSTEARKIPGTYQDMSRILSSVPAAAHLNDTSNDLIVRGGSPWENGFFVDNIPIPNINHFQRQGQSGGPIGLINVQLIENMQILTGGFSAKYGNRMSSIVNIHFREGKKDKFHSNINLHLTGFGGIFEGPIFKNRGAWILSLNRSYYDVLAKIISYDIAPRYGDIHFKLTYDLNPNNKLTLLNIYGDSHLEFDLQEALEGGFNDYLSYRTRQNTAGINWFANWGSRGYTNTSISTSYFRISNSIKAVNPESSLRERSLNQEYNGDLYFRSSSYFDLGKSSKIQFGLDYNNHLIDFDNYVSEHLNRWEEELPEVQSEGRIHASQYGAFLTLSFRPLSSIETMVSFRLDHYTYNNHWILSPRLSLAWNATKRLTLSAAFGIFHQNVPLAIMATNPDNKNNGDPYALHYIIGLSYQILEDVKLTIDLYDKEYRSLPLTSEDPTLFIMDSGTDMSFYRSYSVMHDFGLAFVRGVEILLQKKLIQGLYGLFSGTLFRSRFQDINGIWRNRINDNGYALRIIGGYLPKRGWGLSIRFNLSGGLPFTPFDLKRSEANNRAILIREKALSERYSPYMTFDIRIDKEIRLKNSNLFIYFGATNLFNRKNIESYFWNRVENKQDIFYQAPLLPVFGFELVF